MNTPIDGPCRAQPTEHQMGWLGGQGRFKAPLEAMRRISPQIIDYDDYIRAVGRHDVSTERTPPWELVRPELNVLGAGKIPPCEDQFGPSCVGAGCVGTFGWRLAIQIALHRREMVWRRGFIPFTYGASRCHPEIGNGQLGRGGGSYGSWGAKAMAVCGTLFTDDAGAPPDSEAIVTEWGRRGPPKWAYQEASDNPTLAIAPLTGLDQVRRELLNYRPVTVASSQGFDMRPVEDHGLHVFEPSGNWEHQMCWLWWTDRFDGLAYRQNSWGGQAHGTPLNKEPPGGAWNRSGDIEREFKRWDVEMYGVGEVQGDEGPDDPGML